MRFTSLEEFVSDCWLMPECKGLRAVASVFGEMLDRTLTPKNVNLLPPNPSAYYAGIERVPTCLYCLNVWAVSPED